MRTHSSAADWRGGQLTIAVQGRTLLFQVPPPASLEHLHILIFHLSCLKDLSSLVIYKSGLRDALARRFSLWHSWLGPRCPDRAVVASPAGTGMPGRPSLRRSAPPFFAIRCSRPSLSPAPSRLLSSAPNHVGWRQPGFIFLQCLVVVLICRLAGSCDLSDQPIGVAERLPSFF